MREERNVCGGHWEDWMRIAYKFVFPLLGPSHKFLFDVVTLSLILLPVHGENLIHDVLRPEEAPVALDWSWQADHNPIHKVAPAARSSPPTHVHAPPPL